jgi:hypothetical protein
MGGGGGLQGMEEKVEGRGCLNCQIGCKMDVEIVYWTRVVRENCLDVTSE